MLPFDDAAFGAIVVSSVLEYVHDPIAVMRECTRLLEPGGTLLCTVPDLRHPVRWLEGLLGLVARGPLARGSGHPRLDSYLTYLTVSRQRHPARRWRSIAAQAGLDAVGPTHENSRHGALRVMLFRRPA